MVSRREFLKLTGAGTAAMYLATRARFLQRALGATPQPALPLPGSAIPQFVDPLPDLLLVDGTNDLTIRMQEFLADVMPSTFVAANPNVPYGGTHVWGYQTDGYIPPAGAIAPFNTYINPVVLAQRGTPTQITWVNEVGTGAASSLYWEDWTDLTLHWANPTHLPHNSTGHYNDYVPLVPHLHGGEVPPQLDGGPDAWFTRAVPTGGVQYGHAYYTKTGAPANGAIYRYPNSQEAANIWFHDHALGITRINVYAGIAGAYLLSDPGLTLPTGLGAHSVGGRTIIPLVIQDRMFDADGQLHFPNVGDNPLLHPFWAPEFLGDTIVVNGKVWPFKNLDNNRYRFLFLNGSNARAYEMFLVDTMTGVMGPPMWVIGTDGGYLDTPVKIDPNDPAVPPKLVMMPGERYDVI
ncbi:MAG: twin-arginine translocation signal domain-containing protein, partial [Chloroflexota bacterium]